MLIKFKKLVPEAVTPTYAHEGDAGLDLTAISYNYVHENNVSYYNYEFGLSVAIPEGHVGLIFPRSSISKKDMQLSNCVGVLDAPYRGPISARMKITNFKGELPQIYKVGEKVAQLVVVPCVKVELEEVKELDETTRGEGGWGSSGA